MCNIIIVFIVTFAKFKAGVESVDPGGPLHINRSTKPKGRI